MDFLDEDAPARLVTLLGGPADVVMSDMAANATGHKKTDHLRIMGLAETGAEFARSVLAQGGTYIAKVLRGGTEGALLADLKRDFANVRHYKPPVQSLRFCRAVPDCDGLSWRGQGGRGNRGALGSSAAGVCRFFARGDAVLALAIPLSRV